MMTFIKHINQQFARSTKLGKVLVFVSFCLLSCIKDFDISVKKNNPQLVVEAYINNLVPQYNYVVLSRSLDYLSSSFQGSPVANAGVYVTEGSVVNGQYNWDASTKIRLLESGLPGIPANFKAGFYFDPRLVSIPQQALSGTPGKVYLLEISEGGNEYSAVSSLLQPVKIDSLTQDYRYVDVEDSNKVKLRLTNNYKDPDSLNNTQFYYFRFSENRNNFGWGGLSKSRTAGTDDLINGQYIRLTHPRGYVVGDTVNYYMASVTRDVYNFWDSYNKGRDNNGPFATPVTLKSTISGPNVIGCFSGLSLSEKTVIIK